MVQIPCVVTRGSKLNEWNKEQVCTRVTCLHPNCSHYVERWGVTDKSSNSGLWKLSQDCPIRNAHHHL
jgi:hypothetical protein